MKILIKHLRNIIREELLKEDLWSNSYGYNQDEYNQEGIHNDDEETLENLPNDLPDTTQLYKKE